MCTAELLFHGFEFLELQADLSSTQNLEEPVSKLENQPSGVS